MADLVVRATLRDNVLPQLAKIAAGMQVLEKQMSASQDRMSRNTQRNANKTNTEIFKIDNAMRGTARRMASRVLLIGGAIAAVAGHAVALTGALWPMIGALGAIPAVTVGGIAGIAALITGFSGLGAAMKKTGGGASSSASQIASAQRRIEMANRSLRDSQESLNDAWEEASDRLRDIQTSYAGAQLDVEAAALAVREAELALREARSSGDRMERARADLALRQALLAQVEAKNRLVDVEQEYNERLAKGVEGSDEVRDAQERQADALYELAEAQKALNEAMKGGGGGGGEDAYQKLSRSGRELVDTLKRLGPAWREVQQATQEALFAGVATHVQNLSDKFLPVMLRQLPALAQGWNNMFSSIAGVATQDARVRDIDESLGLMATMWQRVGGSFGKFFSGFLNFTRVGADFMPRLGAWVDRMATKFDLWSARVRETGQAHRWIENALVTGHKFNELIKSWGRSLFEVFRLGQDRTLLDRLIAGSREFERWVKTAEGSERIRAMWARLRELGSALWRVIKQIADIFSQIDVTPLTVAFQVLADVLGFAADHAGLLNDILGPVIVSMVSLKVATMAVTLVSGLWTGAIRRVDTVMSRHVPLVHRLGAGLSLLGGLFAINAIASAGFGRALGRDVNPRVDVLARNIKDYIRTGRQGAEMTRVFGHDMAGLGEAMKTASAESPKFVRFFEDLGIIQRKGLDEATAQIEGMDQALAQLVRGGNGELAAAMFEQITAVLLAQGIPIEQLKVLYPEYFALLESGEGTQLGLAGSVGFTAEQYRQAANDLETYSDLLRAQTDPLFAFQRAQEQVAQAQERVNEMAAEYGEGSPQHVQAVRDLQQAVFDLNYTSVEAAKVDEELLIPQLRAMEEQGLLAAGSADAIAAALKEAKKRAQALDGTTIHLTYEYQTKGPLPIGPGFTPQYGGGFVVMHKGGVVPGRRGEEVAAVLQAGEKVTPLDEAGKSSAAATSAPMDLHVYLHTNGPEIVKVIRYEVRKRAGRSSNSVQVALG